MAPNNALASTSDEVVETIEYTKDIELDAAGLQKEGTTNIRPPQPPATPPLQGLKFWSVTLGVCLGGLMISLDISIISTAIPSITSDFHDTSKISWYPAAYTFTSCALTPLAGKMASVFPMNWVYLSALVLFLIGSLVCGVSPSSNVFIGGRAIAGLGVAGVGSNGLVILLAIAPDNKKPLVMGLGASCFAIGLVLAPVLGGVFTEKITWRWCFWINLPLGIIPIIAVFFFFRPVSPRREESVMGRVRSMDLLGSFMFVPAIFMFLLALQRGGSHGNWNSATMIGLFVGSGVTMALFVTWESRKGDDAMIPKSVVGRRTVIFAVLFAFCHLGSLTVAAYYLPEWFQAVQGVGPLESGTRMLATVVPQIFSAIVSSSLARRIKYYNPWFFIGPVLMCTATSLYTQFTTSSTPKSHYIGFQVIGGIGAGFSMQMCSLVVQLELRDSPHLVPIGIALVMFAQYLGATIAQVIAGTIFNSQLQHQLLRDAGLTASQIRLLLEGGTAHVRTVANENFPTLTIPVLEAYNSAITTAFFVSVAATAIEFLLAFGIKWKKIPGTQSKVEPTEIEEGHDRVEMHVE